MIKLRIACIFAAVLAFGGSSLFAQGEGLSDYVVVLANENVPGSVELARYYMDVRGIPTNHLCVLDLPRAEDLSRKLFNLRLREPLLVFLRRQKLIEQIRRNPQEVGDNETKWTTLRSTVRYIVSMYGVPLCIADTRPKVVAKLQDKAAAPKKRNGASVDSELALLLAPPYEIAGPQKNSLFSLLWRGSIARQGRMTLIAARLDGPNADIVRRMIDDTMTAERYGLQGRAYFDSRAVSDPAYQLGDYWIAEAYERFAREGYECVIDRTPPLWDVSYPMEDVSVYMGWYTEHVEGPFLREDFSFMPGAIAYHIHSASARSLRTEKKNWVGPLLARGATASIGAVSEPFLQMTPQLHILADRVCRGYPFGDGAYMALPTASWQMTVVGDPLYRPFLYSLDVQISHLKEDSRAELAWAHVRKMNMFVRDGMFNVALEYGRAQLEQAESPVIREKLGDLYARNELFADAGREYAMVLKQATTVETAVRVGGRWMLILRLRKQDAKAAAIEESIRERWKGSPVLGWLEKAKP